MGLQPIYSINFPVHFFSVLVKKLLPIKKKKDVPTSASSMKVIAAGLHDSLIILIRSGNLDVVSSPFRENMRTDPSTNL